MHWLHAYVVCFHMRFGSCVVTPRADAHVLHSALLLSSRCLVHLWSIKSSNSSCFLFFSQRTQNNVLCVGFSASQVLQTASLAVCLCDNQSVSLSWSKSSHPLSCRQRIQRTRRGSPSQVMQIASLDLFLCFCQSASLSWSKYGLCM